MFSDRTRVVINSQSGGMYSGAEVYIFKPKRAKPFVEAAEAFPNLSGKHEERARRLNRRGPQSLAADLCNDSANSPGYPATGE